MHQQQLSHLLYYNLNARPFGNLAIFNHGNTGLFYYSDPHCSTLADSIVSIFLFFIFSYVLGAGNYCTWKVKVPCSNELLFFCVC